MVVAITIWLVATEVLEAVVEAVRVHLHLEELLHQVKVTMVVLAQTMVLLEAVAVAHLPLALMVLEVELVVMAVMELPHL
jgi:hypothetical protein